MNTFKNTRYNLSCYFIIKNNPDFNRISLYKQYILLWSFIKFNYTALIFYNMHFIEDKVKVKLCFTPK
jgi:hypothetical protein